MIKFQIQNDTDVKQNIRSPDRKLKSFVHCPIAETLTAFHGVNYMINDIMCIHTRILKYEAGIQVTNSHETRYMDDGMLHDLLILRSLLHN